MSSFIRTCRGALNATMATTLLAVALVAPAAAMDTGRRLPPPETVDCGDDSNSICIECGGSPTDGVFCCWDRDNCTVVPKPPPPPAPSGFTRFPTIRRGLGSSAYFIR